MTAIHSWSQSHAPRDYVSSGLAFLKLAIGQLEELPNRLTFCKQRISQAEKLAKLGAGASQGKKEDAEKLIADYLRAADELRTSCQVKEGREGAGCKSGMGASSDLSVPRDLH